ncbi:hypothetical protein STEG23_027204 [Scotinomys teguina]
MRRQDVGVTGHYPVANIPSHLNKNRLSFSRMMLFADFGLQLAQMPLARQYLMVQNRLRISPQPESNIPFQAVVLLCDKQPTNNKGIENFVVMKQTEK